MYKKEDDLLNKKQSDIISNIEKLEVVLNVYLKTSNINVMEV